MCDIFQKVGHSSGGVNDVRKVWQVLERCDGHGGNVKVLGEV